MIEIKNLYKRFEGQEVLRGLNLTVKNGETLVIIGQSGCGKSVMLKHIIGLLAPDSGTIMINGDDIFAYDRLEWQALRLKTAMLFQGAALFDSLTVGENVGFSLSEHTALPSNEIKEIVSEKLALVGLSGIENLKPAELSGGMKKRVGLARAICNDPEIILYDEPTTGLDPIRADAINDLIKDLNHKLKVTSIVVTHDMASAYKIADRIAMLYEGAIIAVGTPDEIIHTDNPVVKQFITGSAEGPITQNHKKTTIRTQQNRRVNTWTKQN
jgi:phospholipid/cholesterol/gamma-HCH transport system ATP-binding protein